jgi:hypothetical protein
MTKPKEKLASRLDSRETDLRDAHRETAEKLTLLFEVKKLVDRWGEGRVREVIQILTGGHHGNDRQDFAALWQMRQLVQNEKDAKGRRLSDWAAARAVARTMVDTFYEVSTAKRLLRKYHRLVRVEKEIDELFT